MYRQKGFLTRDILTKCITVLGNQFHLNGLRKGEFIQSPSVPETYDHGSELGIFTFSSCPLSLEM